MKKPLLHVIRPADPDKALRRAFEITKMSPGPEQDVAFENLVHEQPYVVVGFAHGAVIRDGAGVYLGPIQPGDSLVEIDETSRA